MCHLNLCKTVPNQSDATSNDLSRIFPIDAHLNVTLFSIVTQSNCQHVVSCRLVVQVKVTKANEVLRVVDSSHIMECATRNNEVKSCMTSVVCIFRN